MASTPATTTRKAASASPPKPVSSADTIFRDVIRGLYEGRYVPGQRLVEADLVEVYGASRGSIREALNRLAAEGVVTLSLYKGAAIRALSRDDVRNIVVLLEPLIGLAGKLAAERIGVDGNRERLQAAVADLLRYEGTPGSFDLVKARNAFYRALVEIGGNPELGRVLAGMHIHLVRVQVRNEQTEARRFDDYRAIVEAVLAGDERRAELTSRRHVRNVATALQALPDSAFARQG
jgi:DNA-binding GntR family transcriptional regulator